MKYTCLLTILATAFLNSEARIINNEIDNTLDKINDARRKTGLTIRTVKPFTLNSNKSVVDSDGEIFASENFLVSRQFNWSRSLVRTEDCYFEPNGSVSAEFNLHYGLRLWVQTFGNMKIHGENSSVYFGIRNNSLHLSFTVHWENCKVLIDDYRYEALGGVEFGSSLSKLDGIDVEDVFKQYIWPIFNKAKSAEKPRMEKLLRLMCLKNKNRFDSLFEEESVLQEVIQNSILTLERHTGV